MARAPLTLLYIILSLETVVGFLISPITNNHLPIVAGGVVVTRPNGQESWTRGSPLCAEEETKKKTGIDEKVRTKLLSESIAPWRSLRLFLYGSLGTGALVGGLITLSGTAAVMSGAKDGDMNTELTNLAIDFGAVLVFALLAKFDIGKQKELDERVEERIQSKKEQQKLAKGMKARELALQDLNLDVRVSADGDTRTASVRELQAGARQHMILIVGPRKACRDALVGANLLKMDFAMSNILVVPYEIDDKRARVKKRPEGGFGERPAYETQAYVAEASGEGWEDYIDAEMDAAIEQNGEKTREEGIAIVVSSNGRIIRRGVGKVPWRQMVDQLEQSLKDDSKAKSFL